MLLLIDNYDSFTYNLFHYLGELGAEIDVRRNDALSVDEALALAPQGIVLSPGPCDPDRGRHLPRADRRRRRPGCRCSASASATRRIGQAFGGRVVRAPEPMHGKISTIRHDGTDIFAGLPSPFQATRYHSLMVDRDGLAGLPDRHRRERGRASSWASRHRELPIFGVQFHPESIATEHGHALLRNFLATTVALRRA